MDGHSPMKNKSKVPSLHIGEKRYKTELKFNIFFKNSTLLIEKKTLSTHVLDFQLRSKYKIL